MLVISGTGAELSERTELILGSDSQPITIIPTEGVLFPRIENGKIKNCRKVVGIYLLEDRGFKILLEVLPKGWTSDIKNPGSIDTWAGLLLSLHRAGYAVDPTGMDSDLTNKLTNERNRYSNVMEYFLAQTFQQLVEDLSKGLPAISGHREELSSKFRGRINWAKQLSGGGALKHKFHTDFDEQSLDCWLYRFISSAFHDLAKKNCDLILSSETRSLVRKLKGMLVDVTRAPDLQMLRPRVEGFLRNPPRKFLHLHRSILLLAKWIYNISSIADDPVTIGLNGFQIDLERVFESWCRKSIATSISNQGLTNLKSSEIEERWHWGHFRQKDAAQKTMQSSHGKLLKPDLVFYSSSGGELEVIAIADVKYKDFDPVKSFDDDSEADDESTISRNDFFQVFCYKRAAENPHFVNKHRADPRFKKSKSIQGPKLMIFFPSDAVRADSEGFFGEGLEWSLKIIGLPFNCFLRGEPYQDELDKFVLSLSSQIKPIND